MENTQPEPEEIKLQSAEDVPSAFFGIQEFLMREFLHQKSGQSGTLDKTEHSEPPQ